MATELSSNDTKNYTAIPNGNTTVDRDITIDEIDTDMPLTFSNEHTFGEVFVGGLNKVIKALRSAIYGIKHRKYGIVDNIIAEDMRGQTVYLHYSRERSSIYTVTIAADDDCRDIVCQMTDNNTGVIGMHWHPFMGDNYIELFGVNGGQARADKFSHVITTKGGAAVTVCLSQISYDDSNNIFELRFVTNAYNPSTSVTTNIPVPSDGIGIKWEVY